MPIEPVKPKKRGRPLGSKNRLRVGELKVGDALGISQIQLRNSIAARKHLKRLDEMGEQMADAHRQGKHLNRDQCQSMKVEVSIIKTMLDLCLPAMATLKVPEYSGEQDALSGVIIMPELGAVTSHQPDSRPSQGQDTGAGTGAAGIEAKSKAAVGSRVRKARA